MADDFKLELEEPQIFIRSTDKPFTCADCLFVEFVDLINITYLPFLMMLTEASVKEDFPFDLDKIRCFTDIPNMLLWYIDREYQNPLINLKKDPFMDDSTINEFLDKEIAKYDEFISTTIETSIEQMLNHCIEHGLAKRYVVYYPYNNPCIRRYIEEHFKNKVEFLFGDFEDEVLDKLPVNNATYFFSDIDKIQTMINNDRFEFNTFVIPYDYAYNKDENGNFLIDFEKLNGEYTFKYAYVKIIE